MPVAQAHYTTSDQVQARQVAGRAARRIEDAIAPYTTPGLEAAVVRLLGVAGTDEAGTPLAQRFVEQLHRWRVLGTGAAHWLAGAMVRLRADAPTSVVQVLADDLESSDLAVPAEVSPEVLKRAVRGARRTLEARRRARDDRLATLAVGPGQRLTKVPLGDDAALRKAAREAADLAIVICTEGALPAETVLQHARSVMSQASERAGRYIRLGVRGPANGTAYLGVLAVLTGLDAVVATAFDGMVEMHFARRICAQAGVMVLEMGAGRAAADQATELAQALVAEQLAALAGLSPTSWGWVPGRPAHHDVLATCFPAAFIAHDVGAGRPDGQVQDRPLPYTVGDALPQAIARLETWSPPALDPTTLIKKAPGYWNPFT